jgi:hypothetical protein
MKRNLRMILTCLVCVLAMGTQAQTPQWSVNVYDYRYDMTAYVTLVVDDQVLTDLSDYEIAAFCDNECRGVANIETVTQDGQQKSYGHLRIRSNQEQGETITFKVYNKTYGRELSVENISLTFQSLDVQGLPSNPLQLVVSAIIPGDVDGSGEVDLFDIVAIMDWILDPDSVEGFVEKAADFNNDESVDLFDVVDMMDWILSQDE